MHKIDVIVIANTILIGASVGLKPLSWEKKAKYGILIPEWDSTPADAKTKINQIISRKFQGAILLDLISNFKQPVYMNESNSLHHKIKVINKKNNLLELSAEIKNGSKIKAYFKINFITSKL